jgi:hypothetical protein
VTKYVNWNNREEMERHIAVTQHVTHVLANTTGVLRFFLFPLPGPPLLQDGWKTQVRHQEGPSNAKKWEDETMRRLV